MSIRVERLQSAATCQLPHVAPAGELTDGAVVGLHTTVAGQNFQEGEWGHYLLHDINGRLVFQHMGEQRLFVLCLEEDGTFVHYRVKGSQHLATQCHFNPRNFLLTLIQIIREAYPFAWHSGELELLGATA